MSAARWTTLSLRLGRIITGTSQLPAPFETNPTFLRPPLPSQRPTESREGILPHLVLSVLDCIMTISLMCILYCGCLTCFVMCVCFGNICNCIYCVLYCLYCVLYCIYCVLYCLYCVLYCIYCVFYCLYCFVLYLLCFVLFVLCFCFVSFMYIFLFCLSQCKDYCHRVTTELQLVSSNNNNNNNNNLIINSVHTPYFLQPPPPFQYNSVPQTLTKIYWIILGFLKNRCGGSSHNSHRSRINVCPLFPHFPHLLTDSGEIRHNRSAHNVVEQLSVLCTFGVGKRQCCCGLKWSYIQTWIVEMFDILKVKNSLMTPLWYVTDCCSSKGWWNLSAVNVMVSGHAGNWSWCIVRCFAGSLAWSSHKRWVTKMACVGQSNYNAKLKVSFFTTWKRVVYILI